AAPDRALGDEDEVLRADAVGAVLVITGLVGNDHARLERHAVAGRDADRALVHAEEVPDAVAGAVGIGDSVLPQELPREDIDLRAGGPLREPRHRDSDHALEHARIAVTLFGGAVAGRERARDVGRAAQILAAGT